MSRFAGRFQSRFPARVTSRVGMGLGTGGEAATEDLITPAFDSAVVYLGDSLVYNGGTATLFNTNGFPTYIPPLVGGGLYQPQNGNLGVQGERTDEINDRLGDAIALSPSVVILEGGYNDIVQGVSASTILGYKTTAIATLRAEDILVVCPNIPAPTGSGELTAGQETVRQAVNTGLSAMAGTNVLVVDVAALLTDSTYYQSDGIHPNNLGAYTYGKAVGQAVAARMAAGNFTSLVTGATYALGADMAGTGGSKSGGATGNVATSWTLFADFAGGATVAGSKDADGSQIVTISGTYTGDNKYANLQVAATATLPSAGDVIEGLGRVKVAGLTNVSGVYLFSQVLTAAFANLGNATVFSPVGDEAFPVGSGDGILNLRTPRYTVSAGTPAYVLTAVFIQCKNGGSGTACGATVNVYHAASRKVS